jgi:hypothetical protein
VGPIRVLYDRSSKVSWVRLPSEGGIDREKWQSQILKTCKELNFSIEVGSTARKNL